MDNDFIAQAKSDECQAVEADRAVGPSSSVLTQPLACAAVSGVAILMGLNLLGALPLRLPSLDVDVRQLALPPPLQVRLQNMGSLGFEKCARLASALSVVLLQGFWGFQTSS